MIVFVIIVTSGSKYLDIDAYACIVAYAELLNLIGVDARAISTAPLNESIPAYARLWPVDLSDVYTPTPEDKYILVDTSELIKFEDFVKIDQIIEVIDHRPGFEDFWQDKLGTGAKIEKIGACATQIYEEWVIAGQVHEMSLTTAKLLTLAMLDNTLNFTAHTSTSRDLEAYAKLVEYAKLNESWANEYFSACQETVEADLENAIINDTKIITFKGQSQPIVVGQLAIWEPDTVLSKNISFEKLLSPDNEPWFMSIINIKSGYNIIFTEDPDVQTWLSKLLNVKFDQNKALTNGPYLRKEIMALNLKSTSNSESLH